MELATAESRPGAITYLKLAFLLAILGFKAVEWLHHSAPALAPRPSTLVPPVPDKPTVRHPSALRTALLHPLCLIRFSQCVDP